MLLVYVLLSVFTGITVVYTRIINSSLAEKIGTFQGTLINYITGLSFSIIFLFVSRETINLSYAGMNSIPIWAYFGGLIGFAIIILSNYITPRISAFYSTLLMFVGQLFIGILIDYFSTHTMSMGKLIGGLLVMIGLTYNLWLDKKQKVKTD